MSPDTKVPSTLTLLLTPLFLHLVNGDDHCSGPRGGPRLEYMVGDAMSDMPNCVGPTGAPYPIDEVKALLPKYKDAADRHGRGLQFGVQSPERTRDELLSLRQAMVRPDGVKDHLLARSRREAAANETSSVPATAANATETVASVPATANVEGVNIAGVTPTCDSGTSSTPARLCKSTFNTTAPMYGVSLTSGKPVTIVQIFPDLLQQVVYETCDSKECDLIHGECVQTYVPYLFLVIPLGPVTLTGQDYVLVESGCSCQPKYASPGSGPNLAAVIPSF